MEINPPLAVSPTARRTRSKKSIIKYVNGLKALKEHIDEREFERTNCKNEEWRREEIFRILGSDFRRVIGYR